MLVSLILIILGLLICYTRQIRGSPYQLRGRYWKYEYGSNTDEQIMVIHLKICLAQGFRSWLASHTQT